MIRRTALVATQLSSRWLCRLAASYKPGDLEVLLTMTVLDQCLMMTLRAAQDRRRCKIFGDTQVHLVYLIEG